MGERTFDDFDEYARDYRSVHTENIAISGVDSFYFVEMKVKLLQQYEKNGYLNILDVGCGDGATELYMHRHFPNWKLTAIDVSEKSIKEARKKNIPNSIFKLYDGLQLPFDNDSFDVVYIANVFHHIDFAVHHKIMAEVTRVLKKEGRLYLFEHNPLNPVTRHLVNTCIFDKEAVLLKYSYIQQLLGESGFSAIKKSFIIFFPRKKIWKLLIAFEKYLTWLPFGGQYFFRAKK
jgi:ubiquinone/menaquinone biosynthesis C-methylase UbiE